MDSSLLCKHEVSDKTQADGMTDNRQILVLPGCKQPLRNNETALLLRWQNPMPIPSGPLNNCSVPLERKSNNGFPMGICPHFQLQYWSPY